MSTLSDLLRAFLDEEYADSPVHASGLGLTQFDDQLDDMSEAAFELRASDTRRWLEAIEAIPADGLDLADGIDRDLVLSQLRGRAITDEWEVWRRQPDVYLNPGLSGVFGLFLNALRPEAELVSAAASRLRQVPGNLEDARHNLRPELVPALLLDRAVNQARAGARYARELLPAQVSRDLQPALADAGAVAADAYEAYATFLETELRPKASGEWAFGEERYSGILRDREMLSFDARGLRDRGQQEYDRLEAELRRCAQQIGQTDDWHAVLLQLNDDRPATPEAMRVGYEEWTIRARDFLIERGLVTMPPGEACSVEPSPHFQRPVLAVASYSAPPAFSDSMQGHFFVPFPPDGASDDEVAKRLESNCYPGIPTTSVHEAYPGHHWHLATMKLNGREVRQVLRTPYFTEGWALYAERMMREQGFFTDPRQEMFQYEATIFRAARIVVDTSLHMGEMSWDDAVRYMVEHTALTEPTARAEVTRYCSWPTQASSYLTGSMEIARIRDAFLAARGASSTDASALRDFHDAIAGSGGLPIALAERAAMAAA
jgi:uncharacterized protein (DUF885 family)